MEYYSSRKLGRTFIISLAQGDFILESISELIEKENIDNAYVVSGIGTLDQYQIHMITSIGYPPVDYFESKRFKPYEVAAIQGAIVSGAPHLHVVISDTEHTYAGHLENGCRVMYLAEIVIQEIEGLSLERTRNEKQILRITEK